MLCNSTEYNRNFKNMLSVVVKFPKKHKHIYCKALKRDV